MRRPGVWHFGEMVEQMVKHHHRTEEGKGKGCRSCCRNKTSISPGWCRIASIVLEKGQIHWQGQMAQLADNLEVSGPI